MKHFNKANLGMPFEQLIERANDFYKERGIALINKIPTSFKIERRYDPRLKKRIIVSAYPERKSSVDFIGQYYMLPVAFEAKSTENKTSFPLKNIKEHQLDYLRRSYSLNALSFVLIECKTIKTIFRIKYEQIERFMKTEKRKSIPFDFLQQHAYVCEFNKFAVLDYLAELLD